MKSRSKILTAIKLRGRLVGIGVDGLSCALSHLLAPGSVLLCIASWGLGWEHVSVHAEDGPGCSRTPSWDEMCYIKAFFWHDSEWVLQYHPAKADYVNAHPHTLHLWKPIGIDFPRPPLMLV